MDDLLTQSGGLTRQTTNSDPVFSMAGSVQYCAFAGWHMVLPFCLDVTSAYFSFGECTMQMFFSSSSDSVKTSLKFHTFESFVHLNYIVLHCFYNMAFPRHKRGACGHLMAAFDQHTHCARCDDKGQVVDPCVLKLECRYCDSLTSDQKTPISTPSYKLKKGKRNEKSGKKDSD